ncbi:MAG: AAA domain-containing protein [Cytophagales bacterium]|nr:AAA domain-containing protein [Cytophagales bacterium]
MDTEQIQAIKQRFGINGNAPSLNHAIEIAIQVAPTDMTVLITGESGSGKESFSKIIHALSPYKHGQFIAINCGAIPEGTIDSELFGHEKGAFTGAAEARKGYFEIANGGTVFLDEISEMPMGTQTRLLRVLEYGEFIRVGSSKVQKTKVRVIAATNTNLAERVQTGKFREDLYYRLNMVPISVPPLRDRGDDIILLFRKFATDFADKHRIKPVKLTDAAKERLTNFRFPGNIRQLKNIAGQISVLEMEREINDEILIKYLPEEQTSRIPAIYKNTSESTLSERDLLYRVLFDMKKDMYELKKLVFTLLKHANLDDQTLDSYNELFQNISESDPTTPLTPPEYSGGKTGQPLTPPPTHYIGGTEKVVQGNRPQIDKTTIELSKTEDISHETETESLSIQQKEKELIIKALKKNNNKRKYAARDLEISERTLYRKIKQYDLED